MCRFIRLPRLLSPFLLVGFVVLFPLTALAVRPFVTDDARVVGYHVGQLETSIRRDRDHIQHLNLFALGPTKNSELTMGFVDGLDQTEGTTFSITGPLMQFKYLFWNAKPNAYPGLAFATGAAPPWGKGTFRPNTWGEFLYIAATESLFDNDRVLLHVNIGLSTTNPATVATWGLGTQIRPQAAFTLFLKLFTTTRTRETRAGPIKRASDTLSVTTCKWI